jgi:hypothetical protein
MAAVCELKAGSRKVNYCGKNSALAWFLSHNLLFREALGTLMELSVRMRMRHRMPEAQKK